jgi:ABC-type lipoprotein export system ATPase subunit
LRVLAGLERADHGVVEVAGVDLASLDRAQLADLRRRHIAVSGQSTALLDTMDAVENIDLVRVARGLPADPERVEEWIEALGLAAVRNRPVRVLSGGERQRVAVARVLAAQPAIAILDEPTSRQDEAHAELVVAALLTAARRGIAVIAATHDPLLTAAAGLVADLAAPRPPPSLLADLGHSRVMGDQLTQLRPRSARSGAETSKVREGE